MLLTSTSATFLLNAVAGFRSASRSFTTSSTLWYPKLKSHSGTKKRWRSLPNGLFKRVSFRPYSTAATANAERESQGKAGHSHLNASKSPARKNRLSQTAYSEGRQTVNLKKLLPYG